jgi:putative membrane protein
VPMTAICRNVEIDLRQMLGEESVPAPLRPVNDVLM